MAKSNITKVIVFTVFLLTVWFALFYLALFINSGVRNDIPFESLQSTQPEDSHVFRYFEDKLVESLFYQTDVDDIDNYDTMPTVYYRATYPDGSVRTNVPAADYAQQGDDFFRSRKVFTILSTDTDGYWGATGNKDMSNRRWRNFPNSINANNSHTATVVASVYSYTNGLGMTITSDNTEVILPDTAIEYGYVEEQDYVNGWSKANPCPIVRVAYAFDDAALAAMSDYYVQCRNYILSQFVLIGALSLAGVLCGLWLLITSGRRRGSDELHPLLIDRIPAEVQLLLIFAFTTGFVMLCMWLVLLLEYTRLGEDRILFLSVISGATAVAGVVLLWCMSVIRMLKARTFFRNSIIFTLCRWCWRPFARLIDMARSCFDERAFRGSTLTKSLMMRQIVFMSTLAALLVFAFLCSFAAYNGEMALIIVFIIAILCAVAYWHVKGNIKTYEQINQGMSDSVADQMKSERTKTALITNVSHDLKTPLTSIITYVDLLSQEELSDTARDYVTVLEQKSERLKSMVSDLFDLAKSSSGNLPMELETLDLHRLLEQTIADMRDSIDASGLVLKTSFPECEVAIYSDGKKLYRVFQNIIGNALKYSLAGTRVFVSLELDGERAIAIVRNTAGYEMEFTADEVLQRFVRGDNARSGEGSGLGLSIADSFTSACGGELRLDIDGDLFKVTTSFPVVAASLLAVPKNA